MRDPSAFLQLDGNLVREGRELTQAFYLLEDDEDELL